MVSVRPNSNGWNQEARRSTQGFKAQAYKSAAVGCGFEGGFSLNNDSIINTTDIKMYVLCMYILCMHYVVSLLLMTTTTTMTTIN